MTEDRTRSSNQDACQVPLATDRRSRDIRRHTYVGSWLSSEVRMVAEVLERMSRSDDAEEIRGETMSGLRAD